LQRLLMYEAGSFAIVIAALVYMLAPASETGACSELRDQVQEQAVSVSMAALVPRERETLVFAWNFKSGRSSFQDSTRLSWDGAPPTYDAATSAGPDALAFDDGGDDAGPQAIRLGDILRLRMRSPRTADNSQSIPVSSIGHYAVVVEDGVSVKVCVEPGAAAPGVYTSAIRFDDPDISAAPIGVELTVKESDLRKPVGAALLGLFVGFTLVTLKWHEAGTPRATALAIGLSVAVLGVVPPSYSLWSDNPIWGSDPFIDLFALFAATAIGIFGSAAVAEALTPPKPEPGAAPVAVGQPAGDETDVGVTPEPAGQATGDEAETRAEIETRPTEEGEGGRVGGATDQLQGEGQEQEEGGER
jgi:hypothetical protein